MGIAHARSPESFGFADRDLYVMYNSLDFDRQQFLQGRIEKGRSAALRAELFGNPDVPVVIATARLTTAKRFDLLIRAVSINSRRHRPVNLLLVGDGPERDRLLHLAHAEGVRLVMVGECYDEEQLAQLFSTAAVTVSPGNIGLTHAQPRLWRPRHRSRRPG